MKFIKRLVSILLIVAFALWCAAIGFLYVNQEAMIFPAPAAVAQPAAESGFTPVRLSTPDGETLNLLEHPATPGESWVIAFHGNGGDAVRMLSEAQVLAAAGFGVLVAEYRGYNGSTGRPSQAGLYTDALSAFDYLRSRTETSIHLYAHSLGSAMAVHVAQNREAAGVVLLSPFDSVLAVAQARYPILPLKPFLKHPFPSITKIVDVEEPLIIFHGDGDQVVPFVHGKALHAAAPQGTEFRRVEGAGHNEFLKRGITADAARFFQEIEKR